MGPAGIEPTTSTV
ncbi:hypothetical protein SAMN04515683_1060 [Leifsonia sp. 157MF]|nr:hypothetical protein SAMN04515690_2099 [Leifsonia sp. 197AMF]SDJ71967.1 hypothetical protein SAMN04515683_1060 [Leifsonia sp. 157MF]SEM98827.1 hypothetical protein SAMN04515685_1046 [Leifsonia sp. 467MF]